MNDTDELYAVVGQLRADNEWLTHERDKALVQLAKLREAAAGVKKAYLDNKLHSSQQSDRDLDEAEQRLIAVLRDTER